jgi:hypothetical protein
MTRMDANRMKKGMLSAKYAKRRERKLTWEHVGADGVIHQ